MVRKYDVVMQVKKLSKEDVDTIEALYARLSKKYKNGSLSTRSYE